MIPELGQFALILALCLALVQGIIPLIGASQHLPNWMAVARPAALGQFVFMTIAYACLTYAFVTNDFSVTYVASHSNTQLPLIYRIVSVWGGHEGSLLLWNYILVIWTVAVAYYSRSLPQVMAVRVIAIMGLISIGFLLFLLLTSNPFDRMFPLPLDGNDLNPLLQDPGLIIHPPLLYMGYVGFSVAFSFAIAALLGGQLDSAWARWSRPWTLTAWLFLTLGIALGSWWAYYELGWGGWWFWDPVENASFMPWLVGTALIHSLAVTEKRGTFKNWTVLLAIIAFSLSLLGTFLVRSGVLTSVHAFATDPERGVFILAFLGVVVGGSLVLYAWRAPSVGKGGNFSLLSRETLLLMNNILLVVACVSVLLGTLYPLFLDALGMGKISVGPPYFGTVFGMLLVPLLILLGFGTLTRWKQDSIGKLWRHVRLSFILMLLVTIAITMMMQDKAFLPSAAIAVALWITFTGLQGLWDRIRNKQNKINGLLTIPRAFYGMSIAHFGVAIFIVGVVLSNEYSVEKDVRAVPNEPMMVGDFRFEFTGTKRLQGPNYVAERGHFDVYHGETLITRLEPEKRIYTVRGMPMTEAAIDAGFTRDLYIALGEPLKDGAWSVRVYFKSFIRWIWLGALLMALGGMIAASDRRYRQKNKAHATDMASNEASATA